MQVQDITTPVSTTLFDTTNVRWSLAELAGYVSDGQRAIVLLRPDANAINTSARLVGGTKQTIPADGISLLRVTRNMGSDGNTPGRAIRIADRAALDNEATDWHYNGKSNVVQHYVFDETNPYNYYVYPAVNAANGVLSNVYVEIIYSQVPPAVSNPTDTLTLLDHYAPVLKEYVLFRAYSKDASYAGNLQRASTHMQNFANGLQVSMQMLMPHLPTPSNQGQVSA